MHFQVAGRRLDQPGDELQQRRLACAISADNRYFLAAPYDEIDRSQGLVLGVVLRSRRADANKVEKAVRGLLIEPVHLPNAVEPDGGLIGHAAVETVTRNRKRSVPRS